MYSQSHFRHSGSEPTVRWDPGISIFQIFPCQDVHPWCNPIYTYRIRHGGVFQVLWAELCHTPVHMLKPYNPGPQNAMIFGDGDFKEVIKLKWEHWGRWANITWLKRKFGHIETLEYTWTENKKMTIWGNSKKMNICKPRREASEETKPVDTLSLDFQLL